MTEKSGPHTLLVIEDEQDIQRFLSRVLELEGYRVLNALDGNSGLAILSRNNIDMVLLDVRLPGLDGWSVLKKIKESPRHSRIPVVVITAIAGSKERQRSLRMGAARHLVKPLSTRRLKKTIAAVLS